MQIKYVQTEIEAAIRDYLNSMVTIREGMRIDIDLSATRGPEGFIATINVVPEDAPISRPAAEPARIEEPAPEPEKTPAPKVTRASPARVAKTPAAPTPTPEPDAVEELKVAAQPAVEPEKVAAAEDQASNQTDTGGDAAEGGQGDTARTVETAEEAPAAPAAGKSLFGGLKRPENG